MGEILSIKEKLALIDKLSEKLDKERKTTNTLVRLNKKIVVPVPAISLGLPTFDYEVAQFGGIPKGRVIEIFGPECLDAHTYIKYEVRSKSGKRQNAKGGTIKDLYLRFHGLPRLGQGKYLRQQTVNSEFWAPSINEKNRVVMNRVIDVIKSGLKECLRIVTEDGNAIVASLDHKFYSTNGFICAKNLRIGDIVYIHNNTPFTGRMPRKDGLRKHLYLKDHPYARNKTVNVLINRNSKEKAPYTYKVLPKSRAVLEAHLSGLSLEGYIENCNKSHFEGMTFISPELDVHHRDENILNDHVDNLMILSSEKHGHLHATQRHNNLRFIVTPIKITNIVSAGKRQTYDICMANPMNNFIANKMVVHNSAGKTTTALHIIAETQKQGGLPVFVDAEHALDPLYAQALGVDLSKLVINQPDNGEQALKTVDEIVDNNAADLIVVDSAAALVPEAELAGEIGDAHVGLQARMMSQALRILTGKLAKTGIALIFLNQIREKIGVMYGNPETTSGGRALKFYSSLRLKIRRGEAIKVGTDIIGHQLIIKAEKNKGGIPFRDTTLNLIYPGNGRQAGFDKFSDTVTYAAKNGLFDMRGSWYWMDLGNLDEKKKPIGPERLANGLDNLITYLKDEPKVMDKVNKKIADHVKALTEEKMDAQPGNAL